MTDDNNDGHDQQQQARTSPERRDLVVRRILDVPIELVWRAWTDPELLMQWWGPEGFVSPRAEIDLREGGTSLVAMSSPEFGTQYSTWRYLEIVPLQRIEFIHNLADDRGNKIDPRAIGMPADFPQDQRNAVTFSDLGNGRTELVVTECDWPVGFMMEMSRLGLEQSLDKMAGILIGEVT